MMANYVLRRPRLSSVCMGIGGVLLLLLMTSCTTIAYYGQAVNGHLQIMRARQPVGEVISNSATPDELRTTLERAQRARRFASDVLRLPDNDSYTSYVDLGRTAVTWNVIATERFSIDPQRWCFPVAGCLSYRGYFAEKKAHAKAEELRRQGLDVAVTGASAYSSLGWFDDPILNTMLERGEPLVAGVLFHELAHQQLYVSNDSSFNESFASFVERQGLQLWLTRMNRPDLQRRYDLYQSRRHDFIALLMGAREQLRQLYATNQSVAQLAREKKAVFDRLRSDYSDQKERWGGYRGYDQWFASELNNARIAGVSTYNKWVKAFSDLFIACGEDYELFYRRAAELAELPQQARDSALAATPQSCRVTGQMR